MNLSPAKLFPWAMLAIVLAFVASLLVQADKPLESPTGMPLTELGRIPVSDAGRTKPLDTYARSLLLRISGRQTYETASGSKGPAIEWLMESWTHPEKADDLRVFRIDHPDVLSLVGFSNPGRTRFSWNELRPKFGEIVRQANMAMSTDRKKQDPFQRHLVDLYNKLSSYDDLLSMRTPYAAAPLRAGEQWSPLVVEDPHSPNAQQAKSGPSVDSLRAILAAYQAGNAGEVRRAVSKYDELLREGLPGPRQAASYEIVFNRIEPFYQTSVLYVIAFLLGCFALLLRPLSPQKWAPSLAKAALFVVAVSFLVHTVGLASRIYLQGRPPVTNLYSSAIFIGWGCILISLIGEWLMRSGILQMVAALVGFATLIVAHNLGSSGDTMEMMQAVLDSNFWLATHVVVVTIGYSATFLAGFLACFYVLGGVLTPLLKGEPMKALPKMIYGVICFASVTSFVGTVLGGIWADQSWGRFWGWDPKENGAAMIVVWNLLILHARWGGMVKERGVAALAVVGNIVTAWSWFGTNMLGVGLHSYGFMDSAVFWIILFDVVMLGIMGIALVPAKHWRSLQSPGDGGSPAPSPTPSGGGGGGGKLKVAAARSHDPQ